MLIWIWVWLMINLILLYIKLISCCGWIYNFICVLRTRWFFLDNEVGYILVSWFINPCMMYTWFNEGVRILRLVAWIESWIKFMHGSIHQSINLFDLSSYLNMSLHASFLVSIVNPIILKSKAWYIQKHFSRWFPNSCFQK